MSYDRLWPSFQFHLVFPMLSSRAHFILLAPMLPLVDKAAPELPPPAVPCLPGDAMATRCTKDLQRQMNKNQMCFFSPRILPIFPVSNLMDKALQSILITV